jgi:hypothetical protein
MKRREFLQNAGVLSAAAAVSPALVFGASHKEKEVQLQVMKVKFFIDSEKTATLLHGSIKDMTLKYSACSTREEAMKDVRHLLRLPDGLEMSDIETSISREFIESEATLPTSVIACRLSGPREVMEKYLTWANSLTACDQSGFIIYSAKSIET